MRDKNEFLIGEEEISYVLDDNIIYIYYYYEEDVELFAVLVKCRFSISYLEWKYRSKSSFDST